MKFSSPRGINSPRDERENESLINSLERSRTDVDNFALISPLMTCSALYPPLTREKKHEKAKRIVQHLMIDCLEASC